MVHLSRYLRWILKDYLFMLLSLFIKLFLENETINDKNETINETINQLDTIEKDVPQCFLSNSYSSIADVSNNISKSRATISRIVAGLKKKGLLYHVGARKNGRWVVSNKITKHLK